MFFKKANSVNSIIALDYSKPFIVLNFKTYKEASGANALKLAKIVEKVQEKTKINFIICAQAIDLKELASSVKIPIYAQHVCDKPFGKSTGHIIPENLLDINIYGSLLNHSEKRIESEDIKQTILKIKELGMKSIICAKDDAEVKKFSNMKPIKPDFIAVEPPELIGGEKSVSTSKPGLIAKSVKNTSLPLLVGAGVKDNNDLKLALQGGAKGVLLSSHFVLSKDPEKFLLDLVSNI